MNRIAGIFNFAHAPVDAWELARMIETMGFHGQGTQNIWFQGQVGFGCAHREEHPREPAGHSFSNPSYESCALLFDGRIDNRPELLAMSRTQLVMGPGRISDEELVLAAYEKWGLDCPRHLTGDFAFAIWDPREQRLVCARDPFGVKPFYYSRSKESFVFASTPQALLASGKVPPVICEERIADFLVNPLEGVDKTSSFYKEVFRLPPAHRLIVRAEGLTLERYWELCPNREAGSRTDEDYLEAFRELFGEAVRCRLQDLPAPASMLSGGMDSSAIVGMGCRILAGAGKPLHALAFISNSHTANRETAHIFSVLNQGGLKSHLISQIEFSLWMDRLVKAIETEAEPFDCLMNLNRTVYLCAQEQGLHAVLDGVDGDVLLSGSGHLTQLWRQGAYRTIIGETLKADGLTAEYKSGRRELRDSFLSAFTPFPPGWLRKVRHRRRYRNAVDHAVSESIIERDFAVRSRLGERFARLDSHSPRLRSFRQVEAHRVALEHPFLTVGLERYERVATSFGIEARHPFADVRLAEFCLGLPWHLKTQHGWSKLILRRALEPDLPPDVVWRKDKDSLMWDVNRCILKARGEYFYQITCDEQADLQPYIDLHKLKKFWDEYLILNDETHAELLWSGAALAMWLRQQRVGATQPANTKHLT